jgi:hypothetical protein
MITVLCLSIRYIFTLVHLVLLFPEFEVKGAMSFHSRSIWVYMASDSSWVNFEEVALWRSFVMWNRILSTAGWRRKRWLTWESTTSIIQVSSSLAFIVCVVVWSFISVCCGSERQCKKLNWYASEWIADAFDTEQLLECLGNLKANQPVQIPVYDFKKHQRCTEKFRKVVAYSSVSYLIACQCLCRMVSVQVI